MKFKKPESGRSMVEMLGVLAIIGVLSVGGIAGYSLSMRRHRANQIVDYTSKLAMDFYSQCQKRILDGVVETYANNRCNMYSANSYFTDTDETHPNVGPLPAGLKAVQLDPSFDSNHDTKMGIYTYYDDIKLCQAVASITGTGSGANCRDDSYSKAYQVNVYTNLN